MKTKDLIRAVALWPLVRRFAFLILGFETMPFDLETGDWVYHPGWRHGPVKIVDLNWALCAVAIQLGPKGGIVVWPMDKDMRKADSPNVGSETTAPSAQSSNQPQGQKD